MAASIDHRPRWYPLGSDSTYALGTAGIIRGAQPGQAGMGGET